MGPQPAALDDGGGVSRPALLVRPARLHRGLPLRPRPGRRRGRAGRARRRGLPGRAPRPASAGGRGAGAPRGRLARALAHVVNLLDPDCIVLGGGLSNMAHLYEQVPRLLAALGVQRRGDDAAAARRARRQLRRARRGAAVGRALTAARGARGRGPGCATARWPSSPARCSGRCGSLLLAPAHRRAAGGAAGGGGDGALLLAGGPHVLERAAAPRVRGACRHGRGGARAGAVAEVALGAVLEAAGTRGGRGRRASAPSRRWGWRCWLGWRPCPSCLRRRGAAAARRSAAIAPALPPEAPPPRACAACGSRRAGPPRRAVRADRRACGLRRLLRQRGEARPAGAAAPAGDRRRRRAAAWSPPPATSRAPAACAAPCRCSRRCGLPGRGGDRPDMAKYVGRGARRSAR